MTGAQHKIVGIGVGIAAAYAFVQTNEDPAAAIIAAGSAIGCWLPDIDHDKTKLGRKRKFLTNLTSKVASAIVLGGIIASITLIVLMVLGIRDYGIDIKLLYITAGGLMLFVIAAKLIGQSKTFRWATKHRGLMHTLLMPVVMFAGLGVTDYPVYTYIVIGLIVGYCSHLFADMLTVEGCPVLFPLTKKTFGPKIFKTKDKSCTVAAWTVAILSCVAVFYYFNYFI